MLHEIAVTLQLVHHKIYSVASLLKDPLIKGCLNSVKDTCLLPTVIHHYVTWPLHGHNFRGHSDTCYEAAPSYTNALYAGIHFLEILYQYIYTTLNCSKNFKNEASNSLNLGKCWRCHATPLYIKQPLTKIHGWSDNVLRVIKIFAMYYNSNTELRDTQFHIVEEVFNSTRTYSK